ncbi:helix-turn-helix domain-containing protein [Actinoplanes solisilvae]|uniref:helix-turn-helix domain-containing protein n=1 Tax=Actinoplanes solisilvae TaxID=2486853 RepID=UPI003D7BF967
MVIAGPLCGSCVWPSRGGRGVRGGRLAFDLGRAVRGLRERRGWSQAQLARASGMTQATVSRRGFAAGGPVPTLVVLERRL